MALIRSLKHRNIERQKWDRAIRQSALDTPYALSWYLDLVSPGWDGLVLDDYEAVMPLCRKRKFGIDYLFQPFLAQQLGVFSPSGVQPHIVDDFLSAIPGKFRWIDIHMNESNHPGHKGFTYTDRRNFTLELKKGYDALQQDFSRNCMRNIGKAEHAGLIVSSELPAKQVISFLSHGLANQVGDIKKAFFQTLEAAIPVSVRHGQGELLAVQKAGSEEIVAAGWFLMSQSRVLFQACASSPEGKKHEAMYLLVDHAIRSHASTSRIFDFTGSNLPGVAYFNASFGARPASYPAVFRNNLPFPLNVLKGKPGLFKVS